MVAPVVVAVVGEVGMLVVKVDLLVLEKIGLQVLNIDTCICGDIIRCMKWRQDYMNVLNINTLEIGIIFLCVETDLMNGVHTTITYLIVKQRELPVIGA